MKNSKQQVTAIWITMIVIALVLSACAPAPTPAPTQDVAQIQTEAAQTVVADMTANAPPPPTAVPATPVPATQAPPPGATPDPNIPVAVVPTAVPGGPSAIANFNTTIFSGPGTNYVVYGSFLGGRTAQVVGRSENGSWWAISVPVAPNGVGWVDGAWVSVSNANDVPTLPTPPVPPTVALTPPGPSDPQVTTTVNTHVRTGPGTNFPAYGIAPANTTVRVLGESEDGQWWAIRINPQLVGAGYGWIQAQYTTASNVEGIPVIASPQSVTSAPPPPPPAGAPTATAIEAVNVRSGPGTNFPVLVVAPAGASAEVSGRSSDGGWWQVRIATQFAANGLGWVSADWVTTQNTTNVPVVASPPAPPAVQPTPPPTSGTGCALVSQTPADGTRFNAGSPFSTTWVLQNTGTARWDQAEYDIMFGGALNNVYLHTGAERVDMTTTVQPGGTYNFTVPMLAPFSAGQYGEMWQVVLGSQTICQFWVYIVVP